MSEFPEPTTFNDDYDRDHPSVDDDDSCPECGALTPDACEDWCGCAYCRAKHEKRGEDAA